MVEFLNKFQGRSIKIAKDNSIRVDKPLIFFNILRAISPQVTSWAIVFFELSVRWAYLVSYTLVVSVPNIVSRHIVSLVTLTVKTIVF